MIRTWLRVARAFALWHLMLAMAALDQTQGQKVMTYLTTSTAPAALTTGFRVRLDSTAASASAAGTELTGTGYTAGGQTSTAPFFSTATTASPSVTTCPHTAVLAWTNGSGGAWSIQSLDINDGAGSPVRTMYGNWNGAPVSVAVGNTFQAALDAVTAQGS